MKLIPSNKAMTFVILLGFVSLFADITYEGARSITGQYLAVLGASGTVVGVVAGLGELIGYGFRLVSGYVSDRTKQYWLLTILGYVVNLFAVPFLALAGNWQMAAALIILERFGKSIRTPARDAMLSYATKEMGRGWGFGLHEAMDQIGAILGPLIISLVLYYKGSYQEGFALLLIPALCALIVLICARYLYPRPQEMEKERPTEQASQSFSKPFWLYIMAVSFVAAGYVDFPLIAYHFKKTSLVSDVWMPVFFAIAMAMDGVSALIAGRLYDRLGLSVLIFATGLASLFVPLVFLDGFYFALLGMMLWGIGLGVQESIMRAFVASLVPKDRRGTAYGVLNICFGMAWFLGSAIIGYFIDISLAATIAFSWTMQLLSIPILIFIFSSHFNGKDHTAG